MINLVTALVRQLLFVRCFKVGFPKKNFNDKEIVVIRQKEQIKKKHKLVLSFTIQMAGWSFPFSGCIKTPLLYLNFKYKMS